MNRTCVLSLALLFVLSVSAGDVEKDREPLEEPVFPKLPVDEPRGEAEDLEPGGGQEDSARPPPPPLPPPPPPPPSTSSPPPETKAPEPAPQVAVRPAEAVERSGKYVADASIDYTNYDCLKIRKAPPSSLLQNGGAPYVITEARLQKIRSDLLYCFFDQGGDDGHGDYQKDIHSSSPTIHKNFNFQLPFFGFRFNYTRLSMHGYLEFSDPPEHYTYPLSFPNKDWPVKNDPSFIGIFFSKTRIGKIYPEDVDQRPPGVYFRMERDLQTRTDQFGVEMRERLMWDIRKGVVGSDSFVPKHAVIVTWKNMSFAGGIDNSLYLTNTFQLVLATDEVYTYAIFNYATINWLSHTEAGGDTSTGAGGVPAYVGFNAGNGTQSYEYTPYSQASTLRDLTGRGWGNEIPGRHIFRIDERIMLGSCNKDIAGTGLPLTFAPESGNMLGGTVVNITGPCFEKDEKIRCRFDNQDVEGVFVDTNRAICVQPMVYAEGYVVLEVAVGEKGYNWRGKYFIETPATATERIIFQTIDDVHLRNPAEIRIKWNSYNLTSNLQAGIRISLWGYRETTIRPELLYINMLEESTTNTGNYPIAPANYRNRDDRLVSDCQFGFIMINLTQPETYQKLAISPILWSRPIPLGWYFGPQWERQYGSNWPVQMCNNWLMNDRYLKNFAAEIPQCPCSLEHALNDKGRYMPDFSCDKDTNRDCYYHKTAVHCVKTGAPSLEGSQQECCYDKTNYLMLSYDQQWGSRPYRSHNLGFLPWNEANKVPTLSQWFNDMIPFYQCCLWQEEQAVGCETYRFERRPSQDCVAYQAPYVATVFGDPHIITFDGLEYTFNGKGEFVLIHADTIKAKLDVQARFEQVPENRFGPSLATQLTAVAARGNMSSTVEVRLRPMHAQWRYRLDVFADGKRVYFDRASLKVQHFRGVTVYTPTYILNQSQVIIMFESGAGVEVLENRGYMSARVYLPWTFINQTRGLFGNWSFDLTDDFTLPNGQKIIPDTNINNFESIHRNFGLEWMLEDRENANIGSALFVREYQRTASYYGNRSFVPEWKKDPQDIIPYNRSSRAKDIQDGVSYCGDSYQCRYDYAVSYNRDLAFYSKVYQDSYTRIRKANLERVITCGVLETPRFGRKSNFFFIPGTKVTFECNQGFVLEGDPRRQCGADGKWNLPDSGYTECLRQQEYSSRQIGIISGIILAVLVPIILILIAIWFWYVKKNRKGEASTVSWNYKTARSSKLSQPSEKLQKDTDNDSSLSAGFLPQTKSGILGKPRMSYDRVYRTNEPLPGKPDIDFEDKVWDLEDDIARLSDLTTSDTSQNPGPNNAVPSEKGQRQGAADETPTVSNLISPVKSQPQSPADLPSPSNSPIALTSPGINQNPPILTSPLSDVSHIPTDLSSSTTSPSQSPTALTSPRINQTSPSTNQSSTAVIPPPLPPSGPMSSSMRQFQRPNDLSLSGTSQAPAPKRFSKQTAI